ncbi:hypothetical protein [Aquitalea pelogenes]|uniref:hypothetical protein n=1 Tax=Aquitalea pelogenes TaxID=1293573 RepID=UPI0035B1EB5B
MNEKSFIRSQADNAHVQLPLATALIDKIANLSSVMVVMNQKIPGICHSQATLTSKAVAHSASKGWQKRV